jgi:nucleoside-diphosphate-sugar epimerase
VESRKPHSDYAISKYGAEMEIWRQQEGLDVIIVNPGIIGPGFQEQGSGQLLRKLLTDYGITPGERSIRAVSDVVRMSVELMKSSTRNRRFVLVAQTYDIEMY